LPSRFFRHDGFGGACGGELRGLLAPGSIE
jgi:hypothetical protein